MMNKLKITKNLYKTVEKNVYEKFPWTNFRVRFLENADYRFEVDFYYNGKIKRANCTINNDILKDFEEAEDFAKEYIRNLEFEINRLIDSEKTKGIK